MFSSLALVADKCPVFTLHREAVSQLRRDDLGEPAELSRAAPYHVLF
jgi:hypothetical protein